MTDMTASVRLETSGPVARITFDNVAKHNAVSLGMWRQLDEHLRDVAARADARVALLLGAGPASFVSGADISEFGDQRRSAADVDRYEEVSRGALARLRALPQPTVAAIGGHCIGAGVAIAVSCDLRIASDNARLAIPAARIGLGYAWTELKALVDVAGAVTAKELLITGRSFTAEEARLRGLVNLVVARAELDCEAARTADTIARNAPLTIRAAKTVIAELTGTAPVDVALCERVTNACFASADYQRGLAAFAAGTAPAFAGD